MTTVVANVSINLSGSGDTAGIVYDNYSLLTQNSSQIAFRYTLNGAPVMDVTVTGSFNITDYNASGRITSVSATLPGGAPLLSFNNANISFYSLAYTLTTQNILSGSDQIFGSSYPDTLYGYNGNDYISGGGGDDLISGGYGVDTIDGGDGFDTVISSQNYAPNKLMSYGG